MHKHVLLHIIEALGQHDEYFQLRVDETSRSSISPLQKCSVVICMLEFGTYVDSVKNYLRIGETTTLKWVVTFTRDVIGHYNYEIQPLKTSNT